MKTISLFLAATIGVAPLATATTEMIGVDYAGSVYRINAATGSSTLVGPSGVGALNSLALDTSGTVYAGSAGGNLYVIDKTTGVATLVANIGGDLRGLAISSTDVLYAIFDGGGGGTLTDSLYKIDLKTFATQLIGDTGRAGFQGLAFDGGGTLYGFDVGLGSSSSTLGSGLNKISTSTGLASDINPGDTGPSVQYLAFAATGQLFGGGGSKHYSIDPATGALTLILNGGYPDLRGADFLPPTSSSLALWETYGTGVSGTNGEPTLSLTANPVLGTTIKLGSTSSSNTTQVSILFFGISDISIPAPWGGPLLVDPILTVPQTLPPTGQGLVLPLPADVALCGLKVRFQLAQVDPGAIFGVSASKGLLMRLGL